MANELARINPETMAATVQSLPQITTLIQSQHDKGVALGQALIDTIQANGDVVTPELYEQIGEYIDKAKRCKAMMYDKRSPITQLMDSYRKVFTGLEGDLDVTDPKSVPGILQQYRNKYAAEVERKRQEEARKANAEAMKLQAVERYKADVLAEFQARVNWLCEQCPVQIKMQFDKMDLKNYEGIRNYIENFKERLSMDQLVGKLPMESRLPRPAEIPADYNLTEVRMKVYTANCKAMEDQFAAVAAKAKQNYLDMLTAKKEQLELAVFDEEAAKAKEAELKAHEQAEAEKLKREQEEAAAKAKMEAELKGQQTVAASLFAGMEQAGMQTEVKTKTKKVIKITSKNAFLSLLNFWWINEGQNLELEDLQKTFKKMITFAEKKANGKAQEIVTGEGISWEDEITAK